MRISDWSSDVCSSDLVSEHADKERLLDQACEDVVVGAPRPEQCSQGYVDDDKCGRDEGHFAAEEPEPAINVASEDFEKMVDDAGVAHSRSEERRVGKECVSTCRSRWSTYQ